MSGKAQLRSPAGRPTLLGSLGRSRALCEAGGTREAELPTRHPVPGAGEPVTSPSAGDHGPGGGATG